MTKPSDFILNTDYLALAQTNTAEFTAVFAAETFPSGQANDRSQDFTVPASKGTIDRVLISINGGDYTVGSRLVLSTIPALSIYVYRPNATTIRVRLHEFGSSSYSMPMQTVKVKVSSFKSPNIF